MSYICQSVHQLFAGLPQLRSPFDKAQIPMNGIYVLYEHGEVAHGVDRIVRIGTHTGANQLPSRLEQHFLKENKDRSIFRKNIGRALLNRGNDTFLSQWELDLTSSAAKKTHDSVIDLRKLAETEKRVSEYMQRNFRFVVFRIDNKAQRLEWESKMISTVSLCDECRPSPAWLGLYSPKEKIRESGLWLVNELYKQPLSASDVALMRATVACPK
jgi:hypothetical protein